MHIYLCRYNIEQKQALPLNIRFKISDIKLQMIHFCDIIVQQKMGIFKKINYILKINNCITLHVKL